MTTYTFLQEVHDFNLDNFTPHMGWIGEKPIKIYSCEATGGFYLHDEIAARLFEFECYSLGAVKPKIRYDLVVQDYAHWRENEDRTS